MPFASNAAFSWSSVFAVSKFSFVAMCVKRFVTFMTQPPFKGSYV